MSNKLYTQEMIDKLYEHGQLSSSWIVWKTRCTFEQGKEAIGQMASDLSGIGISASGQRIFLQD